MKQLLKGCKIVNPSPNPEQLADILVVDGFIAEIGENLTVAGVPVLEASGLVAVPGLIDMHVHLREPGFEAKEDIYSGTRAAAAGGFTTVACMPNTTPVIDNAILVAGLKQRAQQEGLVRIAVIGAVSKGQSGKELAEMGDMAQAGAVAFSDDGHDMANAQLLRTGLEYARMFDRIIITHAEEESLTAEGVMHEGAVSAQLGMKGRPAVAEEIAVARDILLAEYTGGAVHIAHVSTQGAVDLIRQAKKRGVRVTAEATPHHLTLSDEEVKGFNTATKVNPPLRSQEHIQALLAGLQDGTIDVIATDHAPHAFEEKDMEYKFAPSGFAGLETALGVVLTYLYHNGKLSLPEIVKAMAASPARILGLAGGEIKIGAPADITLIDLDAEWQVDSQRFYTRGKSTPFEGMKLKGKAVATMVNGQFVMKDGEVIDEG